MAIRARSRPTAMSRRRSAGEILQGHHLCGAHPHVELQHRVEVATVV